MKTKFEDWKERYVSINANIYDMFENYNLDVIVHRNDNQTILIELDKTIGKIEANIWWNDLKKLMFDNGYTQYFVEKNKINFCKDLGTIKVSSEYNSFEA